MNSASEPMTPIKPTITEEERFRRRMTKWCVFPLPVFLTYDGATEFLSIRDDLTIRCDGHDVPLFEYIREFIRFYNVYEGAEPEPFTAQKAMELLKVVYYEWAGYSLWDMYTRFPLYMAYASYSEEQLNCRDRLSHVTPHSFEYWGETVTVQENRLFAVGKYTDLTGAEVIQFIRGKTVSERGAHRRLLHS